MAFNFSRLRMHPEKLKRKFISCIIRID